MCTWQVFQASLRLVGEAWNPPIEWVTASCYTWIGSGHIRKEIDLAESLPGTNCLAFFTPLSVTKKKTSYMLTLGVIKLFPLPMALWINKLECLSQVIFFSLV